eukprot:TRINITY_DN4319_c0_g1_i3.p2 TRINITY_DN4319_c0_g1~~TRINITY_DN4319_c0_g1_i3.p2  ORF type:complete len:280 (-),score=122.42 TRINITY_DN4319_c0_g1_i3:46-885(-)
MRPRAGETMECIDARKFWENTKDPRKSIPKFPKQLFIEISFLKGLAKSGANNFLAAFQALPRNSRTMYVHSYQSYVWNHMTSKRLEISKKILAGDLVIVEKLAGNSKDEEEEADEDEDSRHVTVKHVTEEDIQQGTYTIFDVVMPLPGHSVQYPTTMRDAFKEFMLKDGIDMDGMVHKIKDFSLEGGYRLMLQKPKNLTWKFHRYDDPTIPLTRTDVMILKGQQLTENPQGKYLALEMSVDLMKGSYATMLFREIFKTSTSTTAQSLRNEEFKAKDSKK